MSARGRAAPGSLPGVTSSPDTTGNIQVGGIDDKMMQFKGGILNFRRETI